MDYLSFSPEERSDILGMQDFRDLLEKAKESYKLILLQSPITQAKPDFRLCSRISEGALLLIQAGKLPFWKYYGPIKVMKEENCPIVGLVVSGIRRPFK